MQFIERPLNVEISQAIQQTYAQPEWLANILARRFQSVDDTALLSASLKQLLNPLHLPNMEIASNLITHAMAQQQSILCVVDYDSDGISSGAVLLEGLKKFGANVEILVTDRHADGYGFSQGVVNRILAMQPMPDVVITADLGSSDGHFIAQLQSEAEMIGHHLTMIVTDHHHISQITPPKSAHAFINPHRNDISHQYQQPICGAMVAWNLIAGIKAALQQANKLPDGIDIREQLDYAAIATIADMVPLNNPTNRAVVRYGLQKMNLRTRPAWQLLNEQLGTQQPISAETVGFQISPRINALSRMGDDGHTALTWLTSHSMDEAEKCWAIMSEHNEDRKDEQSFCETLALEQMQQQVEKKLPIIVCHIPHASHGVVGLAANKIVQQSGRPAIIFADADKGQITGSARSIPGYDIRNLLERLQSTSGGLMRKYGGHAAAAGITLAHINDLSTFHQVINDLAQQDFHGELPVAQVWHDGFLPKELLNLTALTLLNQQGPFGQGFAAPSFYLPATVKKAEHMGKNGQHLRLQLEHINHNQLEAIWFNATFMPTAGQQYEWIVTLSENTWRGIRRLQILVQACKVHS